MEPVTTPFAAKFVGYVHRTQKVSKFSFVVTERGFDVARGTPAEIRAASLERDRICAEAARHLLTGSISPGADTISVYSRSNTSPTLFSGVSPLPKGGE